MGQPLGNIVGRNPKQAVIENLRHFKALAETGEIPRNQHQPHGERGLVGKMKESLYGEKYRPLLDSFARPANSFGIRVLFSAQHFRTYEGVSDESSVLDG